LRKVGCRAFMASGEGSAVLYGGYAIRCSAFSVRTDDGAYFLRWLSRFFERAMATA
jgi:hypothetical protein